MAPTKPVEFHYAARSDVGLVRQNNQDSGYAGANLLVLADGMGGPAGGDIASSVAIAHLVPLDTDSHPAETLLPSLRDALMDAHEELSERSEQDPELAGLGTTCIALMRSGNKLAMVHIGDSRAYLLRGDTLTQVTTDHSFVQYLVDSGQITPEEAEHHPQRNVVMRILGDSQADVTPDETMREAVVGDRWLLCSDGLSGVVSSDTIAEILTDVRDPGECAEELIRLALLAGGPDNVTCVVADIVPAGTIPPSAPQIVGAAAKDRLAPTRGGGGAAARAAALASPTKELPVDDEAEAEADAPRRSRFAWLLPVISLMLAIGVVIAGWLGWQWSQSQYYVMGKDGSVVIFQGIPQSVGSWNLSHAVEITDVKLDQLAAVDQQRLQEPVTRSSRGEVDAYVAILRSNARERALQQAREAQQAQQSEQNSDQQNQSQPTPTPEATQEGGN
ncbi:PP2C family protein-serine/threonine phosphatase [Actinomyces sp. Marseille-QA0893]